MPNDMFMTVIGEDKVAGFLNNIRAQFNIRVHGLLKKIIKELKHDIIRSMERTPKDTHRQYLGRDGKWYNPSRPGNPPGIASGNLVNNIITNVVVGRKEAILTFDSDGFYINYLEEGTKRMDARPSVFPAADKLDVGKDVMNMIVRIIRAY